MEQSERWTRAQCSPGAGEELACQSNLQNNGLARGLTPSEARETLERLIGSFEEAPD